MFFANKKNLFQSISTRNPSLTIQTAPEGWLELYRKNLRNFDKKYAFRHEPNMELFQVQIRADLYKNMNLAIFVT